MPNKQFILGCHRKSCLNHSFIQMDFRKKCQIKGGTDFMSRVVWFLYYKLTYEYRSSPIAENKKNLLRTTKVLVE